MTDLTFLTGRSKRKHKKLAIIHVGDAHTGTSHVGQDMMWIYAVKPWKRSFIFSFEGTGVTNSGGYDYWH